MNPEIIKAVKKSGENEDQESVKAKLRAFLDAHEPELVYFLQTLWHNQGRAITYKEIREAILSGEFSENKEITGGYAERWLNEWRQDYSKFVTEKLRPKWLLAMEEASKKLEEERPGWYFNPSSAETKIWAETRGAAFVTNSTNEQIRGLRALIHHASSSGMSVDELARAVRPMVGLTYQQGVANANYLRTLIDNGMSEKKATEKAILYGQRQHRYRGYNIARTELAFAYNHGLIEGAKQAQAQGFLGKAVKVWCTSDDDITEANPRFQDLLNQGAKHMKIRQGGKLVTVIGRTCKVCRALNGMRISLDEDFPFKTKLTDPTVRQCPPAHPSCRCTVKIVEIEPPDKDMLDNGPEPSPEINEFYDENKPHNALQPEWRYDIIEEIPESPDGGKPRSYAMGNYLNADGDFDLDGAIDDFRKYLDSVDDTKAENIRFYLDRVDFEKKYSPGLVLGYNPLDEKIYYNPKDPAFTYYDFHTSVTHELSHMIDSMLVNSANDERFTKALNEAKKTVLDKLDYFYEQAEKESNGFFSDIMSGITDGKYRFIGHNKEYWKYSGNKERETFANLYSLEALQSKDKECETALKVFQNNFPEIWNIYCSILSREGL